MSKTIWDREFMEMVETGSSEQNHDIPEQSPINIDEVSVTCLIERKKPSMSQVSGTGMVSGSFGGGCWWQKTSTRWWEKWRDTAGQQ